MYGVVRFRGNRTILATKFAVDLWKNPKLHIWSYSMHKNHIFTRTALTLLYLFSSQEVFPHLEHFTAKIYCTSSSFNSFSILYPLHQLPFLSDLQGKRMFSEVHFRVWDGRIGARRFLGSRTMFKYCKICSEFWDLDQSEKNWSLHLWNHSMHTSHEFPKTGLHR